MSNQGQTPRSRPRPYQLEGARFALEAMTPRTGHNTKPTGWHRAAMIADDPGLGKTFTAFLVAQGLGARRTLVVAPAIGRVSWPLEVRRHWPAMADHTKIPAFSASPGDWINQDDLLLVLSYDTFSQPATAKRWMKALRERRWNLLILDEAHYLKGLSNRTVAIYGGRSGHLGIQAQADRVLLLTGSPTPNHAGELFPHYRTFWADLLTHEGKPLGQTDFEERYTKYTDGPWGRAIHGSQDQDRLRQAFAPVILRRHRRDVLPELPPLHVEDVPLPGAVWPGLTGHAQTIDRLMAVPLDDLIATLDSDSVSLATLRRLLGEAKAVPSAEWARERLGVGVDKILLFAWHTKVIERLRELLLDFNPVCITGDTQPARREQAVHRFQNDPDTRVFLGQVKAAGTAITLTEASQVGIVEPSWVPGENEQVIARAWRLGQKNPVVASFLYVPGSLDQRIMRAFRRKASELVGIYQNEHEKGRG